jgi:hypothetical protein
LSRRCAHAGVPADAHADPLAYPAGEDAILALLDGLLRRTHLSTPSDVPAVIADEARCIGARDVVLYVVDYDLSMLMPLSGGAAGVGEPLSVGGTVAGRAFASNTILRVQGEAPGQQRLWLPLLDGTERVGVMGMSFDEEAFRPDRRGMRALRASRRHPRRHEGGLRRRL